ncbi:MAG: hypothetical protein ABH842_05640 [Candidatus Micrarchaeota archaeon]
MVIGQFRSTMKSREDEFESATIEKPPQQNKSSTSEEFIKTPEARRFVEKWAKKTKEGKHMYTKRGIIALLGSIFKISSLDSDKSVLDTSEELLSMLGGMDGLQGFLMGWKAKSEGLITALKTAIGAK